MPKFCSNCGTEITDEATVCPGCGAPVRQSRPSTQQNALNTVQQAQRGNSIADAGSAARLGIPAPGFSDRVNDPRILAAVKKKRKVAGIFALILVPLPLVGFIIFSILSDKLDFISALKYGGIVSAVFFIFALYGFVKERAKKTYEATVIEKKTRIKTRNGDSNSNGYTEYITVVRTSTGKKKKIVEREGSQIWAWSYLNMGDRFKYHPQFNFPYELFDKSKAPYIACIKCSTHNPAEADCCKKCGLPLIK